MRPDATNVCGLKLPRAAGWVERRREVEVWLDSRWLRHICISYVHYIYDRYGRTRAGGGRDDIAMHVYNI